MQKALEIAVILSAIDRMSRVIDKATNNAVTKFQNVQKRTDAISKQAFATGRDLGMMGLAAAGALAVPIKAAAEFETGMANIRKVVDGLNSPAALKEMGDQILQLSRELPIAQSDLLELVAAGGRMGIPKDQLVNYTRQVAKMATAFDASAGQIGEDMGKLAVVFNIPIQKIGALADAVNYLDDNSIAKGPEIIEVMRRVGGTAQQIGLAAPNVAALASTFLTMGASAETAGTSAAALMRQLATATMQPGRFQTGMEQLGLNAKNIQDQMIVNPQNTILGVLDKINSMPKNKQVEVTTRLFGKEHGPAVALLAQGIKEYRRELELLNNPKLNGSVQREFEIRQKTLNAQLQLGKNQLRAIAVTAGSALLPMITRLLAAVTPFIERMAAWIDRNQELTAQIGALVAGFAAFSLAGSGISFMVGGVAKGISLVTGAFSFLTKGVGMVIKIFRVLQITMMTNPILLIATAIAVAVVLIIMNWSKIVAFFKNLWAKVKPFFSEAWEWIKNFFLNYSLPGLIIKHWGDIKEIVSKFYNAGKNIVLAIWNGIKSLAMKPVEAIKDIVSKVRDFLPFSPAKVGPLRDLHRVRIVETIAATMKPGPMVGAMEGVAVATARSGGRRGIGAAASAGGVTINFSPSISVGMGVGGSARADILTALRQFQPELVRLVEEAVARRDRAKF